MHYVHHDTPIGPLLMAADGDTLAMVRFPGGRRARDPDPSWIKDGSAPVLRDTTRQIDAYFAGDLRDFDLPLAPRGTAFQLAAWEALQHIPYGETVSYGDQAKRLGRPRAARAVGAANGQNPIPVIIPCHRVIGGTGKLTGFGGGVETKAYLLEHERRVRFADHAGAQIEFAL